MRNYDANQGDLFLAGKPIADYMQKTHYAANSAFNTTFMYLVDTLRQNLQFTSAVNISDEK